MTRHKHPRLEAKLVLHGQHHVTDESQVHVLDFESGEFVPAASAAPGGRGPCKETEDPIASPIFNEIDDSYRHLESGSA